MTEAVKALGIEIGSFSNYEPLLVEVVKFFRTGKPPMTPEESIKNYAFMEAADESKRQGGVTIRLVSVLAKARQQANRRLHALDVLR